MTGGHKRKTDICESLVVVFDRTENMEQEHPCGRDEPNLHVRASSKYDASVKIDAVRDEDDSIDGNKSRFL